ncbi:MAG TPA: bifunctional D-glycero-beta-D-manno-heptose-7-phosphate kinase/D-glycero-beta-D-manno-heptose 1-phosphate adenylyltransferase HldE [Gammaproteobacteria bacterium]
MGFSLPSFNNSRVLVVGDVVLDSYWHGDTNRISREAPVPIVRVDKVEKRPGGAANVAFNIAALGARPILVGVSGDDEAGDLLSSMLESAGVDYRCTRLPGMPTITKMRVLSRHQQIIRLDIEELDVAPAHEKTLAKFEQALDQADAVILSDYGLGTVASAQSFIRLARGKDKPVFVDPRADDFSRYAGATVITPNLHEFETVAGVVGGDENLLAERAESLRQKLSIDAMLVTRGERGMTLVRAGQAPTHVAAHTLEVYDVTGAGDTVIGVFASSVVAGEDMESAMRIANLAAAVVVGKLGAATASAAEIDAMSSGQAPTTGGVIDESGLITSVAESRAAGETIVMTNGCFDILHAGHTDYLAKARAFGDRLIVAVNDDASVARLKGANRPLNRLEDRMAVLSALACVDWVVPFAEDTPARLIERVIPHVLVKGGDYRADEIPGASSVKKSGGRVEIVPLRPGCSTTATIEAARKTTT